jgi:hypothetical protein
VRQQPGPVIPLIAACTEEQFRDNLAATDVHLSQQHLDRLDALSLPTLGFPADVMREASAVSGVYGAQLPYIDDPRAQAVRRTTTGTWWPVCVGARRCCGWLRTNDGRLDIFRSKHADEGPLGP